MTLENVRGAKGSPFHQLERLAQILEQSARQLEICGFESFREAVVHEAQGMPGLVALPAFAEEAGQDHARPQLPAECRLRACDNECFRQVVHR